MVATIELENRWLRATVLPEVGAKIFDLIWKPSGRNYLWHNPRVRPQPYPVEGVFDNYWCGGWDDGFPTCDPCEYRGERYPGLGELRSLRWNVDRLELALAELSAFGPISPVRVRKSVRLSKSAPILRVRFEVTNIGVLPLDYIWGTHPAIRPFGQKLVLRIPARTGIVAEASQGFAGEPGQHYHWPMLDGFDMSRVLSAREGVYCGHCVTGLEAGWYAIEDTVSGEGLVVRFPIELCPYLWLWLSYGGYRGHHHIIVEPWTSYPMTLAGAVAASTSRCLKPGETFRADIAVSPYLAPAGVEAALSQIEEDCIEEDQ